MDLGLEAAGFRHVGCIEWDELARRSLKANKGDAWPLKGDDIEVAAGELDPNQFGLVPGDLDLLVGAPPCQPYSKAAQWTPRVRKGPEDRRGQYLNDFLDLMATFLPKVVMIENVRGFVLGKTSALPHIDERLAEVERQTGFQYRYEARVLDAFDYGVPQRRSRAIVIIADIESIILWPDAVVESRVAWDAIGNVASPLDMPQATGKWAGLLPSIPEGSNYLWHTERGGGERIFGYRTRYWSFLLKLAKDKPSWTLPAHPGPATGPFHWDNRPLTIPEMLRLQSFPAGWIVEGANRADQVRQIGNATPPLLAEVLGRCIATMLDPDVVQEGAPALSLPKLDAMPSARVPALPGPAYLALVGEHEAHPGHGLGPGAMRERGGPLGNKR
jgi:DNA (cytosine-5)-methyltransferase 1